jgi:tetratricopeptide (TPR) repeat protein
MIVKAQGWRSAAGAVLLALIAWTCAAPAAAAFEDDHELCVSRLEDLRARRLGARQPPASREVSIAGNQARRDACTRLIDGGGVEGFQLAQYFGGRAEALMVLATYDIGAYDEAISEFRRMAELDPEPKASNGQLKPGWNSYLFALLIRAKQLKDARASSAVSLPYIEEGLARLPHWAPLYNMRGMIVWAEGREDEALTDFNRALQYQTDYAAALTNRSIILQARAGAPATGYPVPQAEWELCQRGTNWTQAEAACTAVIDGGMQSAGWLGKALAQRGHWRTELFNTEGARADLDRAMRLWENVTPVVYHARLLRRLQDYEGALGEFDRAVAMAPNDSAVMVEVWRGRGGVYFDQNRYAESAQAYDQALALAPGDRPTRDNRNQSRRMAEQVRNNDPAVRAANERQAQAWGRLLTGGLVAAVGGDSGQIAQALAGQPITAAPSSSVQQAPAPSASSPAHAPSGTGNRTPIYMPSRAGCMSFTYRRNTIMGPVYEVRNGCPEAVGYAIGAYANGENRGAGGELDPGGVQERTLEDLRLGPYKDLTVEIIYACPRKDFVELAYGVQIEVVYWDRPRNQCVAMPVGGPVSTAR